MHVGGRADKMKAEASSWLDLQIEFYSLIPKGKPYRVKRSPFWQTQQTNRKLSSSERRVGKIWLYYKYMARWLQTNLSNKSMIRLIFVTLLCASFVGLSSGNDTSNCKRPSLRKEWRALGHDGQKAFTDAIKASLILFVL